jgi:predicted transcriptional regulator
MNNNNLSTEWRRSKVMELSSQGYNQLEIARILQISQPTVSRDLSYLEELSRSNIRKYINHKLPFEYDKCLAALNSLQKKAWEMSENPDVEERTKVQALSLAKECVINKLDLLTNATVVSDSMKFVQQSKEKLRMCLSSKNVEQTTGSHSKEEEEVRGVLTSTTTTNQVF